MTIELKNRKPAIFCVSKTPKGLDNVLDIKPELILQNYCAAINVADSPCATFDYQKFGVPSFWFPINEMGKWGHSPFFGALRVVNEYYKGDKPVLIHCHAGANRSPSVAYAILLAKGYTPMEAEASLKYEGLAEVFLRNIERKMIPKNIVDFLRMANDHPELSLQWILKKMDAWYCEWAEKMAEDQNDYTLKIDEENSVRIVYNKEQKRFILVNDEPSKPIVRPWADPVFKRKEWYITPTVPETEKPVK